MGIESATTISDLNASWPTPTDPKSQGDDHIRTIKAVLQADAVTLSGNHTVLGDFTVSGDWTFEGGADLSGTNPDINFYQGGVKYGSLLVNPNFTWLTRYDVDGTTVLTQLTMDNAGNISAGVGQFSGDAGGLTGLTAAQIPNLNASKITAGTLDAARLPTTAVAKGGTGGTTASAARSNLGLGTMATRDSGTGGTQHRTNDQNDARFLQDVAVADLPDATASRAWVGTAMGSMETWRVGTLAFARFASDPGSPPAFGGTVDGTLLRLTNNEGTDTGPSLSGTWRCLFHCTISTHAGLWQKTV